jgi:phosphatidylserine/phosphatidylglycerophosphate/cardiolipin synthase-like enzyme
MLPSFWYVSSFISHNCKQGSQAAQKYFNSLHRNIHLQRDPIGLMEVWSHHQKTVCIDQDIAFCGGIDIAYNRYEDVTSYPLTDWPDGRFAYKSILIL